MDEYDPTYGLSVDEMDAAVEIEEFIVDNGRVETDPQGGFNYRSYVGELWFEAGERGFDSETADRMAQFAADRNSNVNAEVADSSTVVYFQNPEMCNEQSYWVRDESEPRPSSQEIEETGAGADGYIGGKGWPIQFYVGGPKEVADKRAARFVHECLGLTGPWRWEYVDIAD